ncbi:anaerobic dimethyl sulfoxide reductase subunit B [Escherichia coli]|uniref:Anaerobic dimethyl sulfoxide reductase subunit B n=1 Tax=Escherichia coli TaxID=562 RepID=A0A376P333_ECOLX|nr:anaerobic dimethyl sulfoxide reductase subunit B [Escherichia coli]
MTTQYGFFIDSSRCTGCKTCELACKDYKDLTPEVSSAAFMNMLAATGRKITVSGTRTCLPTICRFHVTTAKIRLVLKSARAVRCIT